MRVEGLDLGLLIDAEHDRVLRWCEVEPADVGDFPDQLGVGGEPKRLGLLWLDPVGTPDPCDRGVAYPQPVRQEPGGPARDPELLRRRLQRLGHDLAVVQRPRPTRSRGIGQPGPGPWTGTPPLATTTPWSPWTRPAPRSSCSPRRPAASNTIRARFAAAAGTVEARVQRSSSSRSPARRTRAGAGRFAMPHDFRSNSLLISATRH